MDNVKLSIRQDVLKMVCFMKAITVKIVVMRESSLLNFYQTNREGDYANIKRDS